MYNIPTQSSANMPQSKAPSKITKKITKVQSSVKKTTKKTLKQKSDSESSDSSNSSGESESDNELQIMSVDDVMEVPKKTKNKTEIMNPLESDESDNSENENSEQKITQSSQKKRGRPKKPIVPVQKQSIPQKVEPEEEQLILHIPIYNDDGSSDKNMFTMKDESDHSFKKKGKSGSLKIIDSLTESDENLNDGDIKELLAEIKKKDAIIKRLKGQVIDQKHCQEIDVTPVCTKDTKKAFINLKLVNFTDNKQIVVDKTNIACWWCCHNFETIPCFIPDRYINDKFYVFGCFCTYNCAMAYNSNMGDNRMNTRTSLIKELHNRIFGLSGQIYLAPAKELLQKFGGPMSIEEFRNNELLCKKEHKINIPPLIPLLPTIEEVYRDPAQNPKNVFKKSIMKR